MKNTFRSQKGFSIVMVMIGVAVIAVVWHLVSTYIVNQTKTSATLNRSLSCEMILKTAQELINSSDNALSISNFGPTAANSVHFPAGLDLTPDGFDRFNLGTNIPYHLSTQDFLNLQFNDRTVSLPSGWGFSNYLNYKNSFNRLLSFASNKPACCEGLDCYQEFLSTTTRPEDLSLGDSENVKIYLAVNVADKNTSTAAAALTSARPNHCTSNNLYDTSVFLDPKTARLNYKFKVVLNENTPIQKECSGGGVLSYPGDRSAPLALVQLDVGNMCSNALYPGATLTTNADIRLQVKTVVGTSVTDMSDNCFSSCLGFRSRSCSDQNQPGIFNTFSHTNCTQNCKNNEPGAMFLCRIGDKRWFFEHPKHWEPCHATQVYDCDGNKAADVRINHLNSAERADFSQAEIILSQFTKNSDYMIDVRAVDASGNIGPSLCGISGSCDNVTDAPHFSVRSAADSSCLPATCEWQQGGFPSCNCGMNETQTQTVTCSCGDPANCTGPRPDSTRTCVGDPCPPVGNCRWMAPSTWCLSPSGGFPGCEQQGQNFRVYKCMCEEPDPMNPGNTIWTAAVSQLQCPVEANRPNENLGTSCLYHCPPTCSPRPPYYYRGGTCCAPGNYSPGHTCYIDSPPTCNWQLGNFTCDSATGIATRSVTCSCAPGVGTCPAPQPPTTQPCGQCSWELGAPVCNTSTGVATRTYACSCGAGQCSTTQPTALTEPCTACNWQQGSPICNQTTGQATATFSCSCNPSTLCTASQPSPVVTTPSGCGTTCNWQLGTPTCDTGTGVETTAYVCSCGVGQCTGSAPASQTRSCAVPPVCSYQSTASACTLGSDADCVPYENAYGSGAICGSHPGYILKYITTTYSCKNPSGQACNTCTGSAPSTTRVACGTSHVLCPAPGFNCGVGYCCRIPSSTCADGGGGGTNAGGGDGCKLGTSVNVCTHCN